MNDKVTLTIKRYGLGDLPELVQINSIHGHRIEYCHLFRNSFADFLNITRGLRDTIKLILMIFDLQPGLKTAG